MLEHYFFFFDCFPDFQCSARVNGNADGKLNHFYLGLVNLLVLPATIGQKMIRRETNHSQRRTKLWTQLNNSAKNNIFCVIVENVLT